jgi:DNA recombination protein RmuC
LFNLIIIILSILILAAIVFLLLKTAKPADQGATLLLLQQQIAQISAQVNNQLNTVVNQLDRRLHEQTQVMQDTNKTLGDRLDTAAQVISRVDTGLGKLQESNQQIYAVGKDISRLSELLRAPSFRGGIGELMLENLLSQILPQQNFALKYKFKNGQQVDAVINIGPKMVPVDSKFPYENFRKMIDTAEPADKGRYSREFQRDVKNHIDKISCSYILPEEGTFDFALMYIPAENIYYETIIKDENISADKSIYQYAIAKKVVPVSPNSFYAYLQSIVLGLRGLQIEKNAQQIIVYLTHLQADFQKFKDDFRVVGSHLTNARNKFEETELKLERFSDRLETAVQEKQLEPPAPPAAKPAQ